MTHKVEDGTGFPDSDTYASEAELTSYATARGLSLNKLATQTLLVAMDYLEQQNFIGTKNTKDQALQWPRTGAVIDGFAIDSNEIPLLLKEAQMEFALADDIGNSALNNIERATKVEIVDVIEVEYMDNARSEVYLKAANNKLTKLLKNSGALQVVRV